MLSIGAINIPSSLVLAPMAGISDLPFRMINRSFGCELAFTEMINAGSLGFRSKNTIKMLATQSADRPLGIQFLANDADALMKAIDIAAEYTFDIIDFNAACPSRKVVSRGKGAGLLKEPLKLQRLLKVIVDHADAPVTVKIRSGWDASSVNAVEVAQRAGDAGISGLFIHGRTREQGYEGAVDRNVIRDVKEAIDIPVIASGDALTPHHIRRLFHDTGCDGVAVARGSFGNPWIFRETVRYLKTGSVPCSPDTDEIVLTMKGHLEANIAYFGEKTGVLRFRKFFRWYTRGMAVKGLKIMAFRTHTRDEMLELIEEVRTLQPSPDMQTARQRHESGKWNPDIAPPRCGRLRAGESPD